MTKTLLPARVCPSCAQELPAGMRSNAVYCNRKCKAASSEKRRPRRDDAARYLKERDRRLSYAKSYQKNNPQVPQRAKRKRKAHIVGAGVFRVSVKDWAREVARHDGCFYCGAHGVMTMDHVIPISRGGRHSIGNLVPACKSCNSSKRDRTTMERRLKLPAPRQRRSSGDRTTASSATLTHGRTHLAEDHRWPLASPEDLPRLGDYRLAG